MYTHSQNHRMTHVSNTIISNSIVIGFVRPVSNNSRLRAAGCRGISPELIDEISVRGASRVEDCDSHAGISFTKMSEVESDFGSNCEREDSMSLLLTLLTLRFG